MSLPTVPTVVELFHIEPHVLYAVVDDPEIRAAIEKTHEGPFSPLTLHNLSIEVQEQGWRTYWRISAGGPWTLILNSTVPMPQFAARWKNHGTITLGPKKHPREVYSPIAFRESDFEDADPSPVLEKLMERYGEGVHVIEDPELA